MKLLHVIPSISPVRGGPSIAVEAMTRSLAAAGVHVEIATTDDNGMDRLAVPLDRPVNREGVLTHFFPRQTRFYTTSWPLTTWLARHTRDFDLVHIHALFSYPSMAAAALAVRSHIPYVLRPLGTLNTWGVQHRRPLLKRLSFQFIERRVLNHAALIQYTSKQEQVEAAGLGSFENYSVVVPLGVDIHLYDNLPAPDELLRRHPVLADRFIILFLGRLDPKKGLDLLLPAFAQLRQRHPEALLVLAGGGDSTFLQWIQEEALHLGIETDLLLTGHLSGSMKLEALAAAGLFVLPSYSENFSVATVEAMAAGLPVLITTAVGIAPAVQEAGAGCVVPCEVDGLAGAMDQLVSDPAQRARMGVNGRILAGERFSMEASTRNLVAMYEQAVGSASR